MAIYAGWCGRALALAHARSGDSAMLSGYMGKKKRRLRPGDRLSSFAYAAQNEKDHTALARAVRKGKVKAVFEEPAEDPETDAETGHGDAQVRDARSVVASDTGGECP